MPQRVYLAIPVLSVSLVQPLPVLVNQQPIQLYSLKHLNIARLPIYDIFTWIRAIAIFCWCDHSFISASRTRCFLASSLNEFIGIGFSIVLNNLITFNNCSTVPVHYSCYLFSSSQTHTFFKSRVNSSLPVSICFNTLHRRFEIGRPSRNFSTASTAAS